MFRTDNYRVVFNYARRNDNTPFAVYCAVQKDDQPVAAGSAYCSKADQFDRRVGRKLAFTRAISGLPREERAKLWEEYWHKLRPQAE